jgi:hypothetical protein
VVASSTERARVVALLAAPGFAPFVRAPRAAGARFAPPDFAAAARPVAAELFPEAPLARERLRDVVEVLDPER